MSSGSFLRILLAYELNRNLATATCLHVLKIAGMKAIVREPDVVRELLTDASFFACERPFPIEHPSDNSFIDSFGLALNKAATETKEAMYLVSI
ncbi:hypothetical protein AMTR_s00082p00133380 [Amborella trichopoda]|uniref:Uncharacterized protein n=1 Tax=Amborella trichopoda TaxID=13333 RepID=W1NSK5_AMBTC|nr:hypothetical protein AMTR_s00082p00133380 [Amborella trichopoda]